MPVEEERRRRSVEGDSSGGEPSGAASRRTGESGHDRRRGRGGPSGPSGPDDLDPFSRAREICLNQLTTRARSRAELAAVLARRGVDADVAATVLDRLTKVGLIDDKAFAAAVVASGRTNRGLARRALAADLRRRGVDEQASAAALAAVEPEDELASARALVAHRLRSVQGHPPEVRARRLTAMLARKGYPAGLASRVVAEALHGDEVAVKYEVAAEYVDDYVGEDISDNDL